MSKFKNLKVRSKLLISFILIIVLASGAGVFIITSMTGVNTDYESAMDITNKRLSYIFKAEDRFSGARIIMFKLYYPENTGADLVRLANELEHELDELREALSGLYQVAAPAVQEKVSALLPMVETYRSDTRGSIDILLSVNEISIDNPKYREAMIAAEQNTLRIDQLYADDMAHSVKDLSDTAMSVMEKLAAGITARADLILYISFGAFAVVAVLSLTIAFWVSGLISKPLIPLAAFMKKAGATGDLTLTPADVETIGKYARIGDEIGQAISGAASFVNHVSNVSEQLKTVADGDLTIETSMLSDEDTMGKSIKNMLDSLNNIFAEIQTTTDQVSEGSKQVAVGAQSLAQGSTEQAATIQQLSSSIADIAQKTRENAETAERTSVLSEQIKVSAEKGSRQMDDMIIAVKDINDASQSISKIIKTIDDIAFQTNILALNAAVEAARAGQHGKGFAVVAEEVRNLAAKSAEAARETGDMIQNSMEKAEFGSSIAGMTAESLSEIVTGINESSNYIAEIAKASENQTVGISQINIGIDQVAQVVQQNSATAEESAAASEEMSGQAAALEELLGLFKISDNRTQKSLKPLLGIAKRSPNKMDIPFI